MFKNGYLKFVGWGVAFSHFLLLAIRLYWGGSFFQGGLGKIDDIPSVANFFETLSIPFPLYNAYFVSYLELIGGAFLVFGLLTRFTAILLAFNMLVALLLAHWDAVKGAFADPQNLIVQTPFNYLLACLILFAFGPGKISLDYLIGRYIFKHNE